MTTPKNFEPKLGQLVPANEFRRDAVHIAVAPVTAACALPAGLPVCFDPPDQTEIVGPVQGDDKGIGVVDPFFETPGGLKWVNPGERFWLFLHPGTITGLRHIWTHPDDHAAIRAHYRKCRKALFSEIDRISSVDTTPRAVSEGN